jgi:hypothetical protein
MTRYTKVDPREKVTPQPVAPVQLTSDQLQAGRDWVRLYDIWDGLCLAPNAEQVDIKQALVEMQGAWTALLTACNQDMDLAQNAVRRARVEYNECAKTNGLRTKSTQSLRFYDPSQSDQFGQ